MLDSHIFESCAHYASGMATISFSIWTVILYKWRKRNRMTFLLFLTVAYIAVSFLKDTIFLLPPQVFADFCFVENIVSLFDISFVPLACAFFIEATRPGMVTNSRLLLAFLAFFALLPLYCALHAQWILICSFVLSSLVSILTIVIVTANVARYDKYLTDNYSFLKGISVRWCAGCTFGFFLWSVFYQVCFYEPTWFSEMLYDVGFIVIWNIVCLKNRNHDVVVGILTFKEDAVGEKLTVAVQPQTATEAVPLPAKESFIAKSLQRCMETEKLYLNPRLSLTDLAMATGTNKTYLSTYINGLGKTFYDYVNEFRVAEACRIIDEKMALDKRASMADVASQSGFNSISTFNRSFSKLRGITPTSYAHR